MLFTCPLTINDGTSDHIFESQGQIVNAKSLHQRYFEPGAAVGADTRINVKGDILSSSAERKLLQITTRIADRDGILKPVTWNITANFAKSHDIALVVPVGNMLVTLASSANLTKLCQGYV